MDPASSNAVASLQLQRAADLLAPVQAVLAKFNYKHKNQHRLSKWWAAFDMLRRHAAKLARDDIPPALHALAAGKPRRRAAAPDHLVATVTAKALWMNDYLIPKIYLPITQLAADNQFAHLGLLLLGLLSQVHSAVALLLPRAAEPAATPPPPPAAARDGRRHAGDLGEPVSRDGVAAAPDSGSGADRGDPLRKEPKRRKKDEAGRPPRPALDPEARPDQPAENVAPKTKESVDNMKRDNIDVTRPPKSRDKATKKKKKKVGDEFDQLFSSLL